MLSKIYELKPGEIISNITASKFDGYIVLTNGDLKDIDKLPISIPISSYSIDKKEYERKIITKNGTTIFFAPENCFVYFDTKFPRKIMSTNINFVFLGDVLKQKNCYYVHCLTTMGNLGWFRYE